MKTRLAAALSDIDNWVLTNWYKPFAANDTACLGQLITDMQEGRKSEAGFSNVNTLMSLQAWSSEHQIVSVGRYITML